MTETITAVLTENIRHHAKVGRDAPLMRFVLEVGQEFTVRPWDGPLMKERECFRNALVTAQERSWDYVEGFALNIGLQRAGIIFPVEHAWCVDEDGYAVDPTWPDAVGSQYLGVRFTAEVASAHVVRNGHWGLFNMANWMRPDELDLFQELAPDFKFGEVDPKYLEDRESQDIRSRLPSKV